MRKNPAEYPIINREGRVYSFLDCTCKDSCIGRDCLYCAFEGEEMECPSAESEAD